MMNEVADNKLAGLTTEQYMELSQEAKYLYSNIFDYCTYSSDPQYQRLHQYRNSISKLSGRDHELMVSYFNNDPVINWNGISSPPYEYYRKPYYNS